MLRRNIVVGLALLFCAGCESYATPGGAADLQQLSPLPEQRDRLADAAVQPALEKKPLARFPTVIAAVRLQAPGYRSDTAEGWGCGNFSIVTTRDVESPEAVAKLEKLPDVTGIAPLNRLLLPQNLQSDAPLRSAALALRADILLVYTFDTTFHTRDMAAPLTVVTLGLAPDQTTSVVSTASAVLLDCRTGYVYGVAEATEERHALAAAWTNESAVDGSRRAAEAAAFDKLVDELAKTWTGVVREHAAGDAPARSWTHG